MNGPLFLWKLVYVWDQFQNSLRHASTKTKHELQPRYTVISPGYKIPWYFSELSSGKYTARFKNFTTARMHWHMYGFQWHFRVIFPSQNTIWGIILFTMYYFTAINIFLSLHYTKILNSIIIPSIAYRTRQAGSESFTESHPILRKDKFTTNINLWQFSVLNRSHPFYK